MARNLPTTKLPLDDNSQAIPVLAVSQEQTPKTFNATSAQSAAFATGTTVVRLVALTETCYIAFGSNPTATSSSTPLIVNTPEYFKVTPGQKVAVIQSSAGGTLHITEME